MFLTLAAHKKISVLIVVFFAVQLSIQSQEPKRYYSSARINGEAPHIDGIINEDIWNTAEWAGDFTQTFPQEKQKPSQQSRFKIIYDNENLYVAIQCFDSSPDSIIRRMSRRDGFEGDWARIIIDSYHDQQTAFSFCVTAAGVKGDEAVSQDGGIWDATWDPIWYVKTSIDEEGWNVEMKIPFTQLRFSNNNNHIWGMEVARFIYRKGERSAWQFISPMASGLVHNFGELNGIENIKPKRQYDIIPYTVLKYETYRKDKENPFSKGQELSPSFGVDGKIGLTNNMTLDFTINPDFGQVEADPSEVNLSTFETFLDEKRPFFIEGRNITNFRITPGDGNLSQDILLYSRRIGSYPTYYPDLGDTQHIDMPENTTILGAFKITGRTQKGWSIGILESFTQKEIAEIDYEGFRRKQEVEPFTNYYAARIQKELNEGNTRIGGMFTATNRNFSSIETENRMHKAAYTGGLDFNHQWNNKKYYFTINSVFSHVEGNEASILQTQTNAPHFFQREFTDHIEVDSSGKYINGYGGIVNFGRTGNGKWNYTFWLTWRSPGLELNDMGYMRTSDEIQQVFWVGYNQQEQKGIIRYIGLNLNQWSGYTFGGENVYIGGNFNGYTQFTNFWSTSIGISRDGSSYSTAELRGGPSVYYKGGYNIWTNVSTDSRKKIQFGADYNSYIQDANESSLNNYSLNINFKPVNAFSVSLNPVYFIRENKNEFVQNVDNWDEMRYVRALIKQKEFRLVLRMNYNITPDFTIQYYGMPFISAGKYDKFKYVNDPKEKDPKSQYIMYSQGQISYDINAEKYYVNESPNVSNYEFDQPNFNRYDFNSNLVLRWEYKPGSVFYAVWAQNRNNSIKDGKFDFTENLNDLFDIFPKNVFLIKMSYRIGV